MSTFSRPWALCGGWAVDAWLGRVTREHGDIDITVFHDDQRALFDHLTGWHFVAHDRVDPGPTEEVWGGRELVLPVHLHARPPGAENLATLMAAVLPPYRAAHDGLDYEFVLNARDGDELILTEPGRHEVRAPLSTSIDASSWRLPTVTPAFLLFWKATAYFFDARFEKRRALDETDFRALVPQLSADSGNWLHEAIASLHPDHPWLPLLV